MVLRVIIKLFISCSDSMLSKDQIFFQSLGIIAQCILDVNSMDKIVEVCPSNHAVNVYPPQSFGKGESARIRKKRTVLQHSSWADISAEHTKG